MKPDCASAVQAVAKTLGRKPLSAAQIQAVDDRISATMRQLARTDQEWQAKSRDERVQAASEQAMADIAAEAARKVENAQRQILKTAATESRIADTMTGMKEGRGRALVDDIDKTGQYINGIKQEAVGNLMDLMDASKSGQGAGFGRRVAMFLFDADNPVMTRDVTQEIFRNGDGSTGNKVAQEGAKAWLKGIETLRQRFNSAGGDVGKLDYGYLPQPHDSARVRTAGRDAWVDKIMPLLDRARYVDEAGARIGDADLRAILGKAWETISTEGLNKTEPGGPKGSGAKANAGSESRQLHFKDADGYLAYTQEFGAGSMYDAMIGHVGRMARDIGLIERYGPNPNAQMRLQFDLAERADGSVARDFGLRPQSYWDQLSGVAGTPQSARLAQIGTDVRNLQTMGKLGGAVISSVTDLGTFFVTTGFNKLSYWDAIGNIGKSAGSKDARDFMTTHGVIAESMIGDMQRWTGDNIRQNWSGRLANSTMKLSLMNAWTDTLRRAFSLTMMQGLAKISKTEWGKLGEWDRTHLERKGITEADWQVIQKAELTDFSGKQHLTPEAIRAGVEKSDALPVEAPPPAAGTIRLYHGSATPGRYDGKAWFSTDRKYAESYRGKSAELQYVDMPADRINKIADPNGYGQTVEKGFTVNVEFDASETGPRRPLVEQRKASPEDSQRANEVVAKVLGLIQDESEYAVLNPDLATKTIASGGATQRGTVRGELARSVMQFKSFPIAMVSRHWRRVLEAPKVTDGSAPAMANRVMYAGALMVSTTVLGAIAMQAKQMIQGKDPIDMTGPHAAKFWGKAVAQGGGLSIAGDFLLNDPSESYGGFMANAGKTALGPAIGTAAEAVGIGVENAWKASQGKETHTGAQALRVLRSNTPYLGLWYARAAIDHAGMHALQESLSPGYLSKMKQRASKEWGQQYWWSPGTGGPERAPDIANAVGG